MKPKYPCSYSPSGMCPPECITNNEPLCEFDDCPHATRRMNENNSKSVQKRIGLRRDNDERFHCM